MAGTFIIYYLLSSSFHCCGFCKLRAASMCGQVSFTCLLTLFFFTQLWRFFRLQKIQHCRALSRGWLDTSSLVVLLWCCTISGTFLSFWPFIFPCIYYREAFRVRCFAQKVIISRNLQVSTLEDWQGVGHMLIAHTFLISFILHACTRGNILLPILGSAWPGSQLQHSNMLKSKMHMP